MKKLTLHTNTALTLHELLKHDLNGYRVVYHVRYKNGEHKYVFIKK